MADEDEQRLVGKIPVKSIMAGWRISYYLGKFNPLRKGLTAEAIALRITRISIAIYQLNSGRRPTVDGCIYKDSIEPAEVSVLAISAE